MNKKYYVETNGDNMLVVVNGKTAAWWSVKDLKEADNMDCSEVIDYTPEQFRNEFPDRVFSFNPDDFEKVVEL